MLLILDKLYKFLYNVNWTKRDMTMAHLPFLGSPLPLLLLTAGYLAFIFKIGPLWMKNRRPYNLKQILIVYNLLQIGINFYYGITATYIIIKYQAYEDYGCMTPRPPGHPFKNKEVTYSYVYFMLKIFDYFDTIFFVLRKNYKQVTFLHVYHHVVMTSAAYTIFRYVPCGGQLTVLGVINLFIHGFMYTYYFLTAYSANVKRSLWWKKYITLLQILQFVILLVHNTWPLLLRPDCQYPRIVNMLVVTQSLFMICMFSNFYYKAYVQKPKQQIQLQEVDKTDKKQH